MRVGTCLILSGALALQACAETSAIRHDQLEVLATASSQRSSPLDRLRLITRDGTSVEISDDYDLTVTLVNGREFDFYSPVVIERAGGSSTAFYIRGSNIARWISIEDVAEIEVTERYGEGGVAVVVTAVVSAIVAAGVFVLISR